MSGDVDFGSFCGNQDFVIEGNLAPPLALALFDTETLCVSR